MIRVGVSGLSYKDRVWPYCLPERGELAFYSHEFSTCELNFPYRLPMPKHAPGWLRLPPGFIIRTRCSGDCQVAAGATTRVVSTFDV